MHEVGIAVRSAEPPEDSNPFTGALLRLVKILVEVVVDVPRTFFLFERAVLENEARVLIDRSEFSIGKSGAEKLMPSEAEKVRPHPALTGNC